MTGTKKLLIIQNRNRNKYVSKIEKEESTMEKLFLTSNEVADLLNISQQQAYKIIRDMNKQLAENGFLILRGRINKKYFMEQIYKAKEGE